MQLQVKCTDFGDFNTARLELGPQIKLVVYLQVDISNNSTVVNTIDFVTIATTGNASDFGDLTVINNIGGTMSTTRGVFTGGTILQEIQM